MGEGGSKLSCWLKLSPKVMCVMWIYGVKSIFLLKQVPNVIWVREWGRESMVLFKVCANLRCVIEDWVIVESEEEEVG